MVLIYVISLRSLSLLFIGKSETIQPIQEQEIVDTTTVVTKTEKISNSDKINSWLNIFESWENKTELTEIESNDVDLWDIENQDIQNSDDEYEEIIFQDNFDKEYWSGTEDNYFE